MDWPLAGHARHLEHHEVTRKPIWQSQKLDSDTRFFKSSVARAFYYVQVIADPIPNGQKNQGDANRHEVILAYGSDTERLLHDRALTPQFVADFGADPDGPKIDMAMTLPHAKTGSDLHFFGM